MYKGIRPSGRRAGACAGWGGKRAADPAENSLALSLPPACVLARSRLKVRVETCKRKNGSTKESDIGQTREQVWPSDGQTETAGRAVEVRKRQRHGAGHRELKQSGEQPGRAAAW